LSRLAAAAFGVGLAVRLLLLPTEGTADVQSWKAWAYTCATDGPSRIYGSNEPLPFTLAGVTRALSGDVANRKVLWNGQRFYVDYPPLTMYYLTAVGRLYLALDPSFSDSPLLDALVKLPSLVADALLALLLYWYLRRRPSSTPAHSPSQPPPLGEEHEHIPIDVATAEHKLPSPAAHNLQSTIYSLQSPLIWYWLNPGLMLALGLGYLDASFTLPLVASVIMLLQRRYLPAWLLFTIAALTKLQGVFLLPVLLLVSIAERGRRTFAYVAAAVALGATLLLPYILNGRFTQLLAGLSYNGQENFVSGNNANLWWLISYAHAAANGGLGARTVLYRVTDFTAEVGVSPRLIGLALYALFVAGTLAWLWTRRQQRASIAAAAAMLFYGYTMLLTQVHENHLYPFFALWLLFVALGGGATKGVINHAPTDDNVRAQFIAPARTTRVYLLAAAVYLLNLFLFYGLGRGTLLGEDGGGLRMALGFDLTVPLAGANLLLFGWSVYLLLRWQGSADPR